MPSMSSFRELPSLREFHGTYGGGLLLLKFLERIFGRKKGLTPLTGRRTSSREGGLGKFVIPVIKLRPRRSNRTSL